jgi:malate synthase
MKTPFMEAYVRLLIQTCHKRGVHAMGGMAAQIPIKNDKKANEAAMAKVFADKQREVLSGHDGTWVAHPALIPIAQQVFDKHMKGPNQIHVLKGDNKLSENDLLHAGTDGSITENGLKLNIDVGLRYLEAWLRGVGCVPIHNKMEDAATAEISRSQIWQWIQHNRIMDNGLQVTKSLVRFYLKEQIATLRTEYGEDYDATLFEKAKEIYEHLMTAEEFPDFLTLAAYKHIVKFRNPLSSL